VSVIQASYELPTQFSIDLFRQDSPLAVPFLRLGVLTCGRLTAPSVMVLILPEWLSFCTIRLGLEVVTHPVVSTRVVDMIGSLWKYTDCQWLQAAGSLSDEQWLHTSIGLLRIVCIGPVAAQLGAWPSSGCSGGMTLCKPYAVTLTLLLTNCYAKLAACVAGDVGVGRVIFEMCLAMIPVTLSNKQMKGSTQCPLPRPGPFPALSEPRSD
jgi:hypothetical protein